MKFQFHNNLWLNPKVCYDSSFLPKLVLLYVLTASYSRLLALQSFQALFYCVSPFGPHQSGACAKCVWSPTVRTSPVAFEVQSIRQNRFSLTWSFCEMTEPCFLQPALCKGCFFATAVLRPPSYFDIWCCIFFFIICLHAIIGHFMTSRPICCLRVADFFTLCSTWHPH